MAELLQPGNHKPTRPHWGKIWGLTTTRPLCPGHVSAAPALCDRYRMEQPNQHDPVTLHHAPSHQPGPRAQSREQRDGQLPHHISHAPEQRAERRSAPPSNQPRPRVESREQRDGQRAESREQRGQLPHHISQAPEQRAQSREHRAQSREMVSFPITSATPQSTEHRAERRSAQPRPRAPSASPSHQPAPEPQSRETVSFPIKNQPREHRAESREMVSSPIKSATPQSTVQRAERRSASPCTSATPQSTEQRDGQLPHDISQEQRPLRWSAPPKSPERPPEHRAERWSAPPSHQPGPRADSREMVSSPITSATPQSREQRDGQLPHHISTPQSTEPAGWNTTITSPNV